MFIRSLFKHQLDLRLSLESAMAAILARPMIDAACSDVRCVGYFSNKDRAANVKAQLKHYGR